MINISITNDKTQSIDDKSYVTNGLVMSTSIRIELDNKIVL